jgi:hypothetical protein
MSEYRIDASQLVKGKGEEVADKLVKSLRRLKVRASRTGSEITVRSRSKSKRDVRNGIRRFLYKEGLDKDFRVLRPEKDSFLIKKR